MSAKSGPAIAQQATLKQMHQDRDRDNQLEPSAGEGYLVRQKLGQAVPGLEKRRVEKLFFVTSPIDTWLTSRRCASNFLTDLGHPFLLVPHEGITL